MRTLTKAAYYDLSLEGVARACSDWGAVDGDDGCSRAILNRENQRKIYIRPIKKHLMNKKLLCNVLDVSAIIQGGPSNGIPKLNQRRRLLPKSSCWSQLSRSMRNKRITIRDSSRTPSRGDWRGIPTGGVELE